MTALEPWGNFYIIVGPSAGALIGLQFVVITLIAERPSPRAAESGAAFTTPSVVHFGIVLLLSAIVTIPWDGPVALAVLWGALGLFGMIYILIVARRMCVQKTYKPVFVDWLYHVLLPLAAYAALAVSPGAAFFNERSALLLVAGASLLLLFTGIYNAWDAVTYQITAKLRDSRNASQSTSGKTPKSNKKTP